MKIKSKGTGARKEREQRQRDLLKLTKLLTENPRAKAVVDKHLDFELKERREAYYFDLCEDLEGFIQGETEHLTDYVKQTCETLAQILKDDEPKDFRPYGVEW